MFDPSKLNPKKLTQAEAAWMVGVHRSTLHAWVREGMPYEKPRGKGQPAYYRGGIVIHWAASRHFSDRGFALTPLQRLAAAKASGIESHQDLADFLRTFPNMVAGYFELEEIQKAMHWALGFINAFDKRRSFVIE